MEDSVFFEVTKSRNGLLENLISLLRMSPEVLLYICPLNIFHEYVACEAIRIEIIIENTDHVLVVEYM